MTPRAIHPKPYTLEAILRQIADVTTDASEEEQRELLPEIERRAARLQQNLP